LPLIWGILGSEYTTGCIMKFINPFYLIFGHKCLLLFCRGVLHRQLVEIGKQLVFFELHLRVVSDRHSRLVVSEDLVLFNLRETTSAHYDAATLVLMDLII
jgi:hypothetical protein